MLSSHALQVRMNHIHPPITFLPYSSFRRFILNHGLIGNASCHKYTYNTLGIPADIRVHESTMKMCEINFLCVHKKLRSKRLAPVLIKEITRRVNLRDIWQAVYTAGVVLPRPLGRCRYYHRSLNPKKLIEIKFSRLQPRMTMARTIKLYKLPDTPQCHTQPLTPQDLPGAHKLLTEYLKK